MNQRHGTIRVFSLRDLGIFSSAELDSVGLVAHAVLGSLGSTLACGKEGNMDVEQAGDKLEMELHLESGACEVGEISLDGGAQDRRTKVVRVSGIH